MRLQVATMRPDQLFGGPGGAARVDPARLVARHVTVSARRARGELRLTVRDDGVGLPAGFDPATSSHLGLEIVRTLVEDDLRGTLALRAGTGTSVVITVPVPG